MLRLCLVALCMLLIASPAHAAGFELERWLDEPDVKLVAVEFYADWCEPCKESAPRWEALRKKYARDGLKLVVVNISKNPGAKRGCSRLPWNPDKSLCDPALGEELGVKSLPEAFLWSWQGNLLVERGQHVAEVERIIRRYLDDNPRVQVMATDPQGQPDKALQRQVESALANSGKLTVVPDAEMRKRLDAVRRSTHGATKRDDQRCALGEEVSPNSLLTAERFKGALSLTLADAVSGCQRANVSESWDAERPERTVKKAIYSLMSELKRRGGIEMPKNMQAPDTRKRRTRTSRRADSGTRTRDDWSPEVRSMVNVKFDSEPPGARVTVDGEAVCDATPCKRPVAPGRHRVTMTLDRYLPLERTENLEAGKIVGWSLEPNFGTLSVTSDPPGLTVRIEGDPVGQTPLEGLEREDGRYEVTIESPCHHPETKEVTVPRGEAVPVAFTMEPLPAGVEVQAVDARGDAVEATISVDGEEMDGQTPNTWKVPACAKQISVRHPDHGEWSGSLSLTARDTVLLNVNLLGGPTTSGQAPQHASSTQASTARTYSAESAFSGWSLVGYCNRTDARTSWGLGPLYGCYNAHAVGFVFAPFFYGGTDGGSYGLALGTGVLVAEELGGIQLSLVNLIDRDATFMQFGLWNDVGGSFYGMQFGGVNLVDGDVTFMQLGGWNDVGRDVHGVQIGGVNLVGGNVDLGQIGLYNEVKGNVYFGQIGAWNDVGQDFYGLQLGVVNLVSQTVGGMQLGGLNFTKDLYGFQIGGMNIVEDYAGGFQIGAINWAQKELAGIQIGAWNWVETELAGMQIGVLNNLGRGFGLQIGVVNQAFSGFTGVQIGAINIADGMNQTALAGSQIGGANIVMSGEFRGLQLGFSNLSYGDGGLPFMFAFNIGF